MAKQEKGKVPVFMVQFLIIFLGVNCAASEKPFTCPPESGKYPDPTSSSRFYECTDGEATLHTCGSGTVFKQGHAGCVKDTPTDDSAGKTDEVSKKRSQASTLPTSSETITTATATTPSATITTIPLGKEGNGNITRDSRNNTDLSTKQDKAASDVLSSVSTSVKTPVSDTKSPKNSSTKTTTTSTAPTLPLETTSSTSPKDKTTTTNTTTTTTTKTSPTSSETTIRTTLTPSSSSSGTSPSSARPFSTSPSSAKPSSTSQQTEAAPKAETYRSHMDYVFKQADEIPDIDTYRARNDGSDDEEDDFLADTPQIEAYNHRRGKSRPRPETFVCPKESGFFRHPTNCSRFYWCVESKPTSMFCSPGTAFDPDTHVCSWIVGDDGCGGRLAPATHTDDLLRRKRDVDDDVIKGSGHDHGAADEHHHKHDDTAGSHHDHHQDVKEGDHDVTFLDTLAAALAGVKDSGRSGRHPRQVVDDFYSDDIYNDDVKVNDARRRELAASLRRFQCPGDGFYPDPEDCSIFYHCSIGKAYQHQCQPGTAFNPDKFVCSWPVGEGGCGGMLSVPYREILDEELGLSTREVNPNFRCPMTDGYYADPDDCRVFYHCTMGKPFQHRCGGGTAFNQEQGVCAWPLTENGCGGMLGVPYNADIQDRKVRRKRGDGSMANTTSDLDSKKAENQKNDKTEAEEDSKSKPRATPSTTTVTTTTLTTSPATTPKPIDTKAAKGKNYRQTTKAWPWDKVERKRKRTRIVVTDTIQETKPTSTPTTTATAQKTTTTAVSSTTPKAFTTTSASPQSTKSSSLKSVPTDNVSSATSASTKSSTPSSTLPPTTEPRSSIAKVPTTPSLEEAAQRQIKAETYRVTGTGAEFRCPSPSGHFRDPMNCAIYYHCAMGVAYRMDCPNGELYDEQKHQCLPIAEVTDCHLVDEKLLEWEEQWANTYPEKNMYQGRGDLQNAFHFDCPEAYGHFRNPADCTAYVECIDGVPYPRKCMSGTVFDPKREKCTWGSLVPDCHMVGGNHPPTENVEPVDFQCPTSEGYYRDPFSCSAYYHCIDGRPMPRVCDPNFFFDPRSSTCRWARLVQDCNHNGFPIFMEKLPLSQFVCPLPNGHFRDPQDCTVFYHCLSDYPYRGECRRHHAFDVESLKCVPRDEVPGCDWPDRRQQTDRVTTEEHVTNAVHVTTEEHVTNAEHVTTEEHVTNADRPTQASDVTQAAETPMAYNDDSRMGKQITLAANTFRCPKAHGLFRDTEDCRIFYHCFAGRHFRHECQYGTVFSTDSNLCTWPSLVPECQEVTTPPLVTSYESTDSQSQTTSDNVPNSTQPQRDEKRVKSERKPFIPFYADEGMKTKFQVEKVPPSEVAFTTPESHEGHDFEGFEFDMADPNRRHVPEISSDGLNDFRLEAPLPDKASNPRVHAEPYSDFVCPAIIFDQYFRDPLDCTVFHRCVKGVRFTFNCPRGTFFDAVYDICDFMENVPDCDHEGRRLGSSREAMGEFAPGVFPGGFYETGGESMLEAAPNALHEGACPKSDGLFPHPTSCQKFLYCSRGFPIVLTCPADLLYNTDTMTCDYDENIVCVRYDK